MIFVVAGNGQQASEYMQKFHPKRSFEYVRDVCFFDYTVFNLDYDQFLLVGTYWERNDYKEIRETINALGIEPRFELT